MMMMMVCAFSLESSGVQLDFDPTSAATAALLATEFTPSHPADIDTTSCCTNTTTDNNNVAYIAQVSRQKDFGGAGGRVIPIVLSSNAYHASILPAGPGSLLGGPYVDLGGSYNLDPLGPCLTHPQTGTCHAGVNAHASLFAPSQSSCLTTKIRATKGLPLVNTKFTPY